MGMFYFFLLTIYTLPWKSPSTFKEDDFSLGSLFPDGYNTDSRTLPILGLFPL